MNKKYKKAMEEYKALYFPTKISVKSYLTGLFFSVLICLILYLPLINLLFLTHYYTLISSLILLTTLLLVYLLLFFKDRALVEYVPEAKKVNLFVIRIVDFFIISIICIVIYAIILIVSNMIMR